MKKLFLALSGSFAALPGVAIMIKGIGTPPGYAYLFGGIIEAFGSLALALLWIYRSSIQHQKRSKIAKAIVTLVCVGFICLVLYIGLFRFCVVTHPTNHTVLFPLWTSGELKSLVDSAGGRWAALDEFGWFGVYSAVEKMPSYALPVTVGVLLASYQSVFTSFTIAFGLAGFHQKKAVDSNRAEESSKPTPKRKRRNRSVSHQS